jgi:hypothetical protein
VLMNSVEPTKSMLDFDLDLLLPQECKILCWRALSIALMTTDQPTLLAAPFNFFKFWSLSTLSRNCNSQKLSTASYSCFDGTTPKAIRVDGTSRLSFLTWAWFSLADVKKILLTSQSLSPIPFQNHVCFPTNWWYSGKSSNRASAEELLRRR